MIYNVKNGKDLLTLDMVLRQLRYCHNIEKHEEIDFIELGQTEAECYEYLLNNNKKAFSESLKEDYGIFLKE